MWIAKKKKQKNTIIIVSAILLTAAVAFPIVSLSKTAYANYLHTVKVC